EKISRYIYHKKANAHPDAIKLLLTLYYNLEKIVISEDLSEKQKKMILLEDVKRYEALKRQISKTAYNLDDPDQAPQQEYHGKSDEEPEIVSEKASGENILLNLKAIVLGIDWEITDQDLNSLRQEVVHLEKLFADSKPKLILLQGIGTLGAYIKLKKSDAHPDAFSLLHTIYTSLEEIVMTPKTLEEEKAILFPVVDSFNAFKSLVGPTITETRQYPDDEFEQEDEPPASVDSIAPAFADIDEQTHGFQADEEAKALGLAGTDNIGSRVDDFFVEDGEDGGDLGHFADGKNEKISDAVENAEKVVEVPRDMALQGLDVEEDEDDENTGLDDIAPALSDVAEEEGAVTGLSAMDQQPAGKSVAGEEKVSDHSPAEKSLGSSEVLKNDVTAETAASKRDAVEKDIALQGVDVETEADDDSDEESLPTLDGELAPALSEDDEMSVYSKESLENLTEDAGIEEEILQNIEGIFDNNDETVPAAPESPADEFMVADADGTEPSVADTTSRTEGVEEQQASEIAQQVDTFFGADENIVEGEENVIGSPLGEPAPACLTSPSMKESPAEDAGSEEVVFELVEEGDGFVGGAADSYDDRQIAAALESLQTSVTSLEKELDSEELTAVLEQLAVLRQEWAVKPSEMTFLQLLSTVIYHTVKYRPGTKAEFSPLFNYLFSVINQVRGMDTHNSQKLLLAATTKVFDWQHDQLARK
ncbi:MAG: hypothetical protein ACWGOX_15415, partial [Desulforhopalus sp.]